MYKDVTVFHIRFDDLKDWKELFGLVNYFKFSNFNISNNKPITEYLRLEEEKLMNISEDKLIYQISSFYQNKFKEPQK